VLLMGAAALVLFTVSYGTAAVASGDERHYAYAVTLGAALNVLANLALIPAFGMTGARRRPSAPRSSSSPT
jgi:O-antigen/teichoic acid export membrane protein